ncbi:MAG TPA: glycyl-radical enzyme activating protein [Deltaproteobacteria bacterium]|nr:glycyl-radical enzyme activating protein [Deltaproteobacteria bacterium]HOM28380.1 glycyl-radical enzyme activating protein [Deltaproteobacteria bacterium]HPP81632.1 glycyl-radical enzyme activating protein [Deltaproteobacteria bacterium]
MAGYTPKAHEDTGTLGEALILEIKPNSLDDGRGIRTVVFFKGCPLDCVWCHNPESKSTRAELSYDAKACIGCNTCLEVCPAQAIDPGSPSFVDRARCTLCFACTVECPTGALERVGIPMGVEDVLARILPDKPFFVTSGGGVTLSGGEPTLAMDFSARLASRLKAEGIHTLLETCGLFDLKTFTHTLMPFVDEIFYDIKIMDAGLHRRFCGADNRTILSNFAAVLNMSRNGGPGVLPRIPLVPGITDTDENMNAIGKFLEGLGCRRAAVLAYNPLWPEKCLKLGLKVPFEFEKEHKERTWYPRQRLSRAIEILSGYGVEAG